MINIKKINMFSAMLSLFETIKSIAYFSIYLSYNTGKIIVLSIFFCYETLNGLLSTLWTFFVIVNEDLFVFLTDLANRLCMIIGALQNLTTYISDSILYFVYGIKNIVLSTFEVLSNMFYGLIQVITKSLTGITAIIAGIKHMIVLFGSGVWFLVTLIPVFIVYIYFMITYYTGRAMEEMKTIFLTSLVQITTYLSDLVSFFIDVPFEAVGGLLICACLIYAVIKFQVALYSSITTGISIICGRFNRLRTDIFRSTTYNNADTDSSFDTDDSENTDILGPPDGLELVDNDPGWITKRERYKQILEEESIQNCIICTERSKCILLMPCRHLSTCKECTETLQRYQQNCPICRRYINYTIHVY